MFNSLILIKQQQNSENVTNKAVFRKCALQVGCMYLCVCLSDKASIPTGLVVQFS